MRVLVVDESPEQAQRLRDGLRKAGYEVAALLSSPLALLRAIEEHRPDIIVIDTHSPSRDVLEHLVVMSQHSPRPVVMFASDANPETIREATRAGVSAYVVDGLEPDRISPILSAAMARFEGLQALRAQLADANLRLAERKLVERAKGLLMKTRGLDEEAAYALLRRFAMDHKLRLAEVSQQLINAADLLNGAEPGVVHRVRAALFPK
jgi:response regulator NasT